MARTLQLLVLLCAVAAASASRQHAWVNTHASPGDGYEHKIVVALKQSNVEQLRSIVEAVSTPGSASYGQYLTIDEITNIVAPTPDAYNTVYNWLLKAGATRVTPVRNRDVVVAWFPVRELEAAFGVRMTVFKHPRGHYAVRTSHDLRLPAEVAPHVDIVHNVNDFPMPRRRSAMDIVRGVDAVEAEPTDAGGLTVTGALSIGGTGIMVTAVPTCMDGSATKTVPPCADHPPALTGLSITAQAQLYPSKYTNSTTAPECAMTATGQVQCTITVEADYYKWYDVSVTASFGSKTGPASAWGFPVVSTPAVTPQTINAIYGIPRDTVGTNGSQAVGEFEQQYVSESDLHLFFQTMGIVGMDTPVTVVGFNNQSNPGVEANLDIQYIMGVARGVPTTVWSIYANSTVEIDDILKWGYQVGNVTNPPLVNSLSYGMTESHVNEYLGAGYLERSDVEFMKLAARGITIIIADGDTGAGDLGPPPMSQTSCDILHPDWPSQSPYVTAISSTYLTPRAQPICYLPASEGGINCLEQPMGEVVTGMTQGLFWGSGGGFSAVTKRASWQEDMVSAYLKKADLLPPAAMYNAAGRAYPDAITVGHNLMIAQAGKFMPVDGTSASAPVFAGIISLINSFLLDHNMPALGFLNPFLYKAAAERPASFTDITVGDNRCGGQGFSPLCCTAGFKAAIGWDATSGLGSPNYPALLERATMYAEAAKRARNEL